MKILAKLTLFALLTSLTTSCVSTRSTLKNVDDNAPIPTLKGDTFVLTEYSKDKKYGFDPDYPVNVFYKNTKDENLNAERYLRALAGPNGEKITYTKLESCCPFPTKRTEIGAGFLDIYELTWEGQKSPIKLYINIYERGYLLVPIGLTIKK
ncbi:2-dehydro-3-deoxyphosphooctonate aldolase [Flavobacterium sp. IMCC34852]|uniref:2-dehydro-3-deoxyphosphooctonate aldolase n=1 Tax=Flavobacterium rivulicola TaxID=2732161 RepID=A0A7Y3R8X6_9FLAO|nr:2-dehydro-3-deoxyphosphooctonate aldolase [Flavobacterium sp. IMCC34852]NNT71721.1 2-dehydro-3-deoxyphosphooctonate aldolase [Flavobacterium sp. IMCC34852]